MANLIFISYSRKDSTFAHKLAYDLRIAGHNIWIDEALKVGQDWEETIEAKLKEAKEVIVVLSTNAIKSKWVQHEGSIAYGLNKKLFPVLIETLPDDELPLWGKKFQHHNFVDVEYEQAFISFEAALTPRDPIRELLDQRVHDYKTTKELLSKDFLQVLDESFEKRKDKFIITEEADNLIRISRQKVRKEQRTRQIGIGLIAILAGITIVIATLATIGQFRQLIYHPDISEDYWVEIPAGEFAMGSLASDPYAQEHEIPQHKVFLSTYQIGRYEITNSEYAQCVRAGVCYHPDKELINNPEEADFPVVFVNWNDANNFCKWIGGRLPTEAEWEKAARGSDGRLYPWGNEEPNCNLANYGACDRETKPVGQFSNEPAPYVIYDLAGNVWEWVSDWYDSEYYSISPYENPQGPSEAPPRRVLRGSAWVNSDITALRSAHRHRLHPYSAFESTGFRCARDVPQ
jgi:formylglycine-generating enzyme required for sulfatase activity